jgi:DNA-binding NtrC family response regulator
VQAAREARKDQTAMRVLVIEDDQRLARLIKGELEHEHLAVDVAPDGDTGVDLALRGCYDVVIADWMLPGRDGPAICLFASFQVVAPGAQGQGTEATPQRADSAA